MMTGSVLAARLGDSHVLGIATAADAADNTL